MMKFLSYNSKILLTKVWERKFLVLLVREGRVLLQFQKESNDSYLYFHYQPERIDF